MIRSNTCGMCGKPIREDDWYCSTLCEDEAQRRDEESNLDAVVSADVGDGER